MRFTKPIAAALALALPPLSFTGRRGGAEPLSRPPRHTAATQFAAGIFGFAAGAMISGALSQPRYRQLLFSASRRPSTVGAASAVVYRPAPLPPAPVYYDRPAAVDAGMVRVLRRPLSVVQCAHRLLLGFDGQYHFCQ